jgi:hypothetical protein
LGPHERSSRVTQIMQSNTAKSGGSDQPLELPIVIARRQRPAEARCEDGAPVLPELSARCEPIGLLLLMPHLQGIDHRIRERNDPPRSCCLWRHEVEAFARPVLQRLSHATGAAAVSGRSPTPVMASACPAAPCPERVGCTALAPVDNAADLMDARKAPLPHRDTAPTTGPRSEPVQLAVAQPQRQPSADEARAPPPPANRA